MLCASNQRASWCTKKYKRQDSHDTSCCLYGTLHVCDSCINADKYVEQHMQDSLYSETK